MSNYSKQLPSYNDIFGRSPPNPSTRNSYSKPEKKPEIKPEIIKPRIVSAPEEYDDDHFIGHEEECDVCDYIEIFQNMDRQQFKQMFIFSEVIGKPKALRKK